MRALALLKRRGFLGGEVDLFCRSVFALLEGFRSLRENPDVSCHACEEATMSVHLALLGLLRDLDETGFDFNPEVRFDRFCEELEETFWNRAWEDSTCLYGFGKRPPAALV